VRPWRRALGRLWQHRSAGGGGATVLILIAACFSAPLIAPYSEVGQSLAEQLEGPSRAHWMGTDLKGRDLLTRVLYGGRISFSVGLVATAVSLLIGVTYGAISGYVGGRIDSVMMRMVDVAYGLPYMFLVIILLSIIGRNVAPGKQLLVLFVALGAVQWLTMARIVRGQVLSLKSREYVEAARALGASPAWIIVRHILPNLMGPVLAYATLTVPAVMLQEAFLSFLGLGVQPPFASWGSLAAEGAAAMTPVRTYWWLVAFPGGTLAVTLLCLNFLGDGLRDAFDPRTSVLAK